MASGPAVAELSDVRALAQKLFSQCKGSDSPSSYKLLATSVRNLRNALEEVEEDYDPTRTLGPDDVRLFGQIGRSHDILTRLELALQSYRHSTRKDVDTNALSDLKTAFDVATHQLKLAFEATTMGEIPLKLDTGNFSVQRNPSASTEDSSVTRSRKSSVWSSHKESPRSPGTSDATSIHNDRVDRFAGEEKQAFSPSSGSAMDGRGMMDWRTPFADPLSMGIEAATSYILGRDDDDLSMTATARPLSSRSRADSNVSGTTETFVSAPASPEMERKASAPNIDAVTSVDAGTSATLVNDASAEPKASRCVKPLNIRRSSSTQAEESHLSPQTAALERTRSNSNSSVVERTKPDADSTTSTEPDQASLTTEAASESTISRTEGSHDFVSKSQLAFEEPPSRSLPAVSASVPTSPNPALAPDMRTQSLPSTLSGEVHASHQPSSNLDDLANDMSSIVEAKFGGQTGLSPSQLALSDPSMSNHDTGASRQTASTSPPVPTRRPPPPPPPPIARRSKPNKQLKSVQSKYRIVNDTSEDSSSEDELYASSRPSSPAKATSPSLATNPPVATPTIHIDPPTVEQDDKLDEAKTTEQPQNSLGITDTPQPPAKDLETVPQSPSSEKPPIFRRKDSSQSTSALSSAADSKGDANFLSSPQRPKSSPGPQLLISEEQSERQPSSKSPPLPPAVQKRVDAATKASDQMLVQEVEARFKREGRPPPVSPRPRSRYHRPRAATDNSSPAVAAEKETWTESGLEVDEKLLPSRPQDSRLVPRVSVDQALNLNAIESSLAPELVTTLEGTRHGRSASTSQLPPPGLIPRSSEAPTASGNRLTGWYGPGADETLQSELDNERIEHIGVHWNMMEWGAAEEYLLGFLESLIEQDIPVMLRRIRYLLAVCAAWKGDVERAIATFLQVLEFNDPSDLNRLGNCEACYWLGDLYAMTNQRLESVVAYCAAQWGELFNDPEEPDLRALVKAEQEAVQLGNTKADCKSRYHQESRENCGSILDPKVMPAAVVNYLLDVEPRSHHSNPFQPPFQLDANKPRSSALLQLSTSPLVGKFRRNKISRQNFLPYGPWPVQFDPCFAMANVKRERLLGSECDLLSVLGSKEGEAKIPKTAPMSLSRMDCFTSSDLSWLICNVRESLSMLEMEWSEVANDQGVWFVVRHSLMDGPSANAKTKMATVHYFAISMFRQSFRSSYGVEICSHGVSSARIMEPSNLEYERGVHCSEPKRIKKLIRETLEEADKRRPKARKRVSSVGLGLTRSSSDEQAGRGAAPPVPARPRGPSGAS